MTIQNVIRFECDRCGVISETDDRLHPPDGWGAIIILPKPELHEGDAVRTRYVMCGSCVDVVTQVAEKR